MIDAKERVDKWSHMSGEAFVPRKLQSFFFSPETILLSKSKIELSLLSSHSICIPLLFQSFALIITFEMCSAHSIPAWLLVKEIHFLRRLNALPVPGCKGVDSWPLRFLYFTINEGPVCSYFVLFGTQTSFFFLFLLPYFLLICFSLSFSVLTCPPISCSSLCPPDFPPLFSVPIPFMGRKNTQLEKLEKYTNTSVCLSNFRHSNTWGPPDSSNGNGQFLQIDIQGLQNGRERLPWKPTLKVGMCPRVWIPEKTL